MATAPVGLVDEHGTELPDDVDDAEDDATLGDHGEVRAAAVVLDGAAGLAIVVVDAERAVAVLGRHGLELVVHGAGGAERFIARKRTRA